MTFGALNWGTPPVICPGGSYSRYSPPHILLDSSRSISVRVEVGHRNEPVRL